VECHGPISHRGVGIFPSFTSTTRLNLAFTCNKIIFIERIFDVCNAVDVNKTERADTNGVLTLHEIQEIPVR